jgi:hypothetical protein
MPKAHKISTDELGRAMKEFEGDISEVAKHLNVREGYVRERVRKDPKLRPIWVPDGRDDGKVASGIPDSIDIMARKESTDDKNKRLNKALEKNGREVFQKDLESMLSNPDNAEKLRVFESFDDSLGLMMAEALRVTQKVNIRQNMSLFEVTESLKDDLEDQAMDPEERILKTRLFIMACEQQGKFYDRLLRGLDFQLKLHNEKDKQETKRKPGFRPLKELKDVEEEAGSSSTS